MSQIFDEAIRGIPTAWREFMSRAGLDVMACDALARAASNPISPRAAHLFAFMKYAEPSAIRVVLFGQDPYPNVENACGLAFSSPSRTIPASLRNIYAALKKSGLIMQDPPTSDLSAWARRGVLLMNTALTTQVGKSAAHTAIWADFTATFVRAFSNEYPGAIYILLGARAHDLAANIKKSGGILKWGHPSPLNKANGDPGDPHNFVNCTVFTQANTLLANARLEPINWDPHGSTSQTECAAAPAPTIGTRATHDDDVLDADDKLVGPDDAIYAFVDGAAIRNGRANCAAAYAVIIVHDMYARRWSARIDGAKRTNNRAELSAMRELFAEVASRDFCENHGTARLVVIYDSIYAAQCVREWYDRWRARENADMKENVDIIRDANIAFKACASQRQIEWVHVNSHKKEPDGENADPLSEEGMAWYRWYGNKCVDEMAASMLIGQ